MNYWTLFWSFLQIGALSIGGGYAAMPLIQEQTVFLHPWLTQEQFTDLITIAEMTPGPIAINSATFVGMQLASIPGALAATLGCILPSCIIVSILAWIYKKHKDSPLTQGILGGLRPAVVSMIASAGLGILLSCIVKGGGLPANPLNIDVLALALFGIALFVLRKFKVNGIYVMLGSGLLGGLLYLWLG